MDNVMLAIIVKLKLLMQIRIVSKHIEDHVQKDIDAQLEQLNLWNVLQEHIIL